MTTTPAPRRGLFCAHFSALLQSFFARIFSKFRVFFCPTFSAVSAFFWWHFAAVSPPFFVLFFALFAGRRARSPRAARAGSREGQSSALFLRPFLSRFGHQSAPAKPHKQRPERHQTRAHVRVSISSFFLCLYCAISVPPWLPIATHSNTPEAMKNPGIKPFSAKYRGLRIGGR